MRVSHSFIVLLLLNCSSPAQSADLIIEQNSTVKDWWRPGVSVVIDGHHYECLLDTGSNTSRVGEVQFSKYLAAETGTSTGEGGVSTNVDFIKLTSVQLDPSWVLSSLLAERTDPSNGCAIGLNAFDGKKAWFDFQDKKISLVN